MVLLLLVVVVVVLVLVDLLPSSAAVAAPSAEANNTWELLLLLMVIVIEINSTAWLCIILFFVWCVCKACIIMLVLAIIIEMYIKSIQNHIILFHDRFELNSNFILFHILGDGWLIDARSLFVDRKGFGVKLSVEVLVKEERGPNDIGRI